MRIYFFVCVFLSIYTSLACASSNNDIPHYREIETVYPDKIIVQFYDAIKRGELIVFGIRLEKSMLKPVHVEYIYVLKTQRPKLKIYSELKMPIKIASQNNNIFWAVCAVLDKNGHIVETEAHLRFK